MTGRLCPRAVVLYPEIAIPCELVMNHAADHEVTIKRMDDRGRMVEAKVTWSDDE